jgi:tRNA pseudouridine13 synthase
MSEPHTPISGADEPGPTWAPGYRHATASHAPIDFRFRTSAEDFHVEEIPIPAAAGTGTHLHFRIEKREVSTQGAIRRLARALGRDEHEFGYAGRKDAVAVATQWLSIEHVDPDELARVTVEGLHIEVIERHEQKLRLGQLAGNRFRLRLREIGDEGVARAKCVVAELLARGLPNYVGAQRFGRSGLAWRLGRLHALGEHRAYLLELVKPEHTHPSAPVETLRGAIEGGARGDQRRLAKIVDRLDSDLAPVARQLARRPHAWDSAVRAIPRATQSLHLSAFQSRIFHRVLAARADSFDRLRAGDVAWVHESGAAFLVEEEAPELATRCASFELSPSGPLYGPKLLAAAGEQRALEEAAIAAEGLSPEDLGRSGRGFGLRGARRALRVPIAEVAWEREGGDAWLSFRLPPGAFATTLLEELAKNHSRDATGLQSEVPETDQRERG